MEKLISLLILLALLCAGCAAEVTEPDTTQAETADTAALPFGEMSPEQQYAHIKANLPREDYEGYTFTFLTRDSEDYAELMAENITGEPINDAVYERNTFIEETYNITVSAVTGGTAPASTAMKAIAADDDSFDAVSDGLSNLATILITNRALLDINDIDGLRPDEPWWDARLIGGFELGGRSYLLTGDISITDDNFTMALLFNKNLAEDFSLDNIYDLIDSGRWTVDVMYDMAKKAAGDVNGDGAMSLTDDRIGLLSERYGTYGFWAAAGRRVTTKNADGLLEFTLYDDHSVNVFNKAFAFQRDASVTWLNIVSGNPAYTDMLDCFAAGRALFYYGGLTNTMVLRSSETEFGIITMPKYDQAQKEYHNCVSVWNCLAFGVPITNAGAVGSDRTGTILDSMAAVSKYTLTPAYYEITLKGKLSRDNESEAMLDLLMSTRVYDPGTIFDWGKSFSIFYNMTNSGESNFASQYAAVEAAAHDRLAEFNALFE